MYRAVLHRTAVAMVTLICLHIYINCAEGKSGTRDTPDSLTNLRIRKGSEEEEGDGARGEVSLIMIPTRGTNKAGPGPCILAE